MILFLSILSGVGFFILVVLMYVIGKQRQEIVTLLLVVDGKNARIDGLTEGVRRIRLKFEKGGSNGD
jgi:hypothetical protein